MCPSTTLCVSDNYLSCSFEKYYRKYCNTLDIFYYIYLVVLIEFTNLNNEILVVCVYPPKGWISRESLILIGSVRRDSFFKNWIP